MAKKRNKNQGRRYEISEWVDFEMDGKIEGAVQETDLTPDDVEGHVHHTKELEAAKDEFTTQANRVVNAWLHSPFGVTSGLRDSDDVESEDDIAFNTWAAFQGSGVGFWEHISDSEWRNLKKAIESDKKLKKAYEKLESEMDNIIYSAIEEVGGTDADFKSMKKSSISQLKNKLLR